MVVIGVGRRLNWFSVLTGVGVLLMGHENLIPHSSASNTLLSLQQKPLCESTGTWHSRNVELCLPLNECLISDPPLYSFK